MPGTHAAVLPRLCRAVIALLAGLAIVVLAPVFACVDAGTPHHEGGGSLRGSAFAAAAPAPVAYAEAARGRPAGHGSERAGRPAGSRVAGPVDGPMDDHRDAHPDAHRDVQRDAHLDAHLDVHRDAHLDDHASHADCRELCCEPSAALPDAVVRDDSAGAALPAPALPAAPAATAPRAAGSRTGPPPADTRPAPRPGTALLRLVCVSRT
ncbi:hypothetical protein [Streptomyces sp. 184]|uniref:hypothetical protein n=1 Tax=Streptomyces sp. 184 TaxID=1827526 RepID=UPI0038927C6C